MSDKNYSSIFCSYAILPNSSIAPWFHNLVTPDILCPWRDLLEVAASAVWFTWPLKATQPCACTSYSHCCFTYCVQFKLPLFSSSLRDSSGGWVEAQLSGSDVWSLGEADALVPPGWLPWCLAALLPPFLTSTRVHREGGAGAPAPEAQFSGALEATSAPEKPVTQRWAQRRVPIHFPFLPFCCLDSVEIGLRILFRPITISDNAQTVFS